MHLKGAHMNANINTANKKSYKKSAFPQISNILSQSSKSLQSIVLYNLKNYIYRPEFRAGVNALILPWLIFYAICLIGIYISMMLSFPGK
jgi:hypothetical protein